MKIIRPLAIVVIGAALFLCLFDKVLGRWIGQNWWRIEGFFESGRTQWIAVLCLGVYYILFSIINICKSAETSAIRTLELWKSVFLGCCLIGYFKNYQEASTSNELTVLLGAGAMGAACTTACLLSPTPAQEQRTKFMLAAILVVLLFTGCFWSFEGSGMFAYKGHIRWLGPWGNPNFYGMLMGAGALLAVGLSLELVGEASGKIGQKRLRVAALWVTASMSVCMLIGLWKSFSRGAWLGTATGVAYLLFQGRDVPMASRVAVRLKSRFTPYAVAVLCACAVLVYWHPPNTQNPTLRRVVSAYNPNDFSWRNRVSAWEGTLDMMADRPFFGLGWHEPAVWYQHYYSKNNLVETAAINLNDYLMIGSSLGIPPLLALILAVSCSLGLLTRYSPTDTSNCDYVERPRALQAACRAAVICLSVAFWFEGGLLVLPTAVIFWALLELARKPRNNAYETL